MKNKNSIQRKMLKALGEEGMSLKAFQLVAIEKGGVDLHSAVLFYRQLRKANAVSSFKKARHWHVVRGSAYGEALGQLSKKGSASTALHLSQGDSVRLNAKRKAPPGVWQAFYAAYCKGKLDLAFVPAEAEVVAYRLNGVTHRVEEFKESE